MINQLFAGKTVLVVGAGRAGNIGFATAQRLAEQGATVALADLPGSQVKELAACLPGSPSHSAHTMDVADRLSVQVALAGIARQHGYIDAALIASGILKTGMFLDITPREWDQTFAVNCTGVFNVAQLVARAMVARGGRIVVVSSNAGRVPRMTTSAYGASKAAIIHLVHCMALELARHGITVNALCPGSTATSMAIDTKSGGDPDKIDNLIKGSLEEWRTGIPLGRLAAPDDQAAAATFLLSDDARHITGQSLCVDGGQTFF